MSKRFTDTDKWRDQWFRKLSAGAKLAFFYILDNCDCAGVWNIDTELADFTIGMTIPWDKVKTAFGDRVKVLPNGRWWIARFIEFQYGSLSMDCKPHVPIYATLRKHGIDLKDVSQISKDTLSKGYPKGIHTLLDKDKEKEKDKKGSAEGKAQTMEEVIEFCKTIELKAEDGEWFWWKCEGCQWKNGTKAIKNWKATCRSWKLASIFPSQKPGKNIQHFPERGATPPALPKVEKPLTAQFAEFIASRNNERLTEAAKLWKNESDLPAPIRDEYRSWKAKLY